MAPVNIVKALHLPPLGSPKLIVLPRSVFYPPHNCLKARAGRAANTGSDPGIPRPCVSSAPPPRVISTTGQSGSQVTLQICVITYHAAVSPRASATSASNAASCPYSSA